MIARYIQVTILTLLFLVFCDYERANAQPVAIETQAKQVLVDAIRAFRAGEDALKRNDPIAALAAFERAEAALMRIDTEMAATDIGIALLTGQSFGDFDPALVTPNIAAARVAAEAVRCGDTFSTDCVMKSYAERARRIFNTTKAEILAENPTYAFYLSLDEEGPSAAAGVLAKLEPRLAFEQYRLLWRLGRALEIVQIQEALPDGSRLVEELGRGQTFLDELARLPLRINETQTEVARKGLTRLIDAGLGDTSAIILSHGSMEHVHKLISQSNDPLARAEELLRSDHMRPSSTALAYVAVYLALNGDEQRAVEVAFQDPLIANWFARNVLVQELPPNLAARFASTAIQQILKTGSCIEASQFGVEAISALGDSASDVVAQTSFSSLWNCDRLTDTFTESVNLGLKIGQKNATRILGTLVELAETSGTEQSGEFAGGLKEGFSIGVVVAENGSGEAFAALLAENQDRPLSQAYAILDLVPLLTKRGRLDDALSGIRRYSALKEPVRDEAHAVVQAGLGAAIGDLSWLSNYVQDGKINVLQLPNILKHYTTFRAHAEAFDYEFPDASDQIAALLKSAPDPQFVESIVRNFNTPVVGESFQGIADDVYRAALSLDGELSLAVLGELPPYSFVFEP